MKIKIKSFNGELPSYLMVGKGTWGFPQCIETTLAELKEM